MSEEELKIGMYTENDYFKLFKEHNFLGRSMYDAIFDKIHALITENQQLKENNMSMQEEMARTWEKADLYKDVIEEAREYIEKSSLEVNTKEFGNLTVCNSDDLLQILDKAKEVE